MQALLSTFLARGASNVMAARTPGSAQYRRRPTIPLFRPWFPWARHDMYHVLSLVDVERGSSSILTAGRASSSPTPWPTSCLDPIHPGGRMTVFWSLDGKVPPVQNLGTGDALFTRFLSPRHVLDADVVCLTLVLVIGLRPLLGTMFPGSQCYRFQRFPMASLGYPLPEQHWPARSLEARLREVLLRRP